jgi:large conductance mechanosensitive channel
MGFVKEFKEFAFKGNILDLAVAVIIGAAFGRIISSLVDNILMPIIGTFIGKSFETLSTVVNGVEVKYGLFLQEVVNFLIIALVIFSVIRTINKYKKKQEVVAAGPSTTDALLMDIRDELRNKRQ